MAPRWHRFEGVALVFRSVAAVATDSAIVWGTVVAWEDKARVNGPDNPRVTARRHRSSRRPTDMMAYIPRNVAKSSFN